jgi:hypothetical protein
MYAISLLWARLIVIDLVRLDFDAGFSLWNSFHMKTPKVFDEVILPRKALRAFSCALVPGTVDMIGIMLRVIMSTNISLATEALLWDSILILTIGVVAIIVLLQVLFYSPVDALAQFPEELGAILAFDLEYEKSWTRQV